jgi:hypothetical protein
MVPGAQFLSAPEIRSSLGMVLKQHMDAFVNHQRDDGVGAIVAIRQQQIAGFQAMDHLAEQRGLPIALAPLGAEGKIEDRTRT